MLISFPNVLLYHKFIRFSQERPLIRVKLALLWLLHCTHFTNLVELRWMFSAHCQPPLASSYNRSKREGKRKVVHIAGRFHVNIRLLFRSMNVKYWVVDIYYCVTLMKCSLKFDVIFWCSLVFWLEELIALVTGMIKKYWESIVFYWQNGVYNWFLHYSLRIHKK